MLPTMYSILQNKVLIATALSFIISQGLKALLRPSKPWYHNLFLTGGPISAHSCTVTALTLSLFFSEGISNLFIASALFSLIIIRDSLGIRRSVGEQGKTLLKLSRKLRINENEKISCGHTPKEVFFGILIGMIIPILVFLFF